MFFLQIRPAPTHPNKIRPLSGMAQGGTPAILIDNIPG